jgi:hypothetical protein
MSDHGMNDFSDSPHQGEFGYDSNGDIANPGNAALNVLDHQRILNSPIKMATSAYKDRDTFKQGGADLKGEFDGVDMKDWNAVKGRLGNIKTELGKPDGKYKDLMSKSRGTLGIDPLKWLAGTLVDFLIQCFQPLEDVLGVVTGNEARMNVSANMWQEVANAMPPIAEHMNSATTAELAEWEGQDGSTARARIMEMGLMVDGLGYLAMGMNTLLTMMAGVAQALRKFVESLIADGVVWVIKTIAPQIAASIATFGALAPVCIAMTVAKIAGLLFDAYNMIQGAIQFFQSCGEFLSYIQEVFSIMQPFFARMINVPSIKLV